MMARLSIGRAPLWRRAALGTRGAASAAQLLVPFPAARFDENASTSRGFGTTTTTSDTIGSQKWQWQINTGDLNNPPNLSELLNAYDAAKEATTSICEMSLESLVNPSSIFANNHLRLGDVDVYGFDYDYTLALYRKTLDRLIYDLGVKHLVEEYRYPEEILSMPYVPDFAIRGLHYDIRRGWAVKLDTFLNVQIDSVFCGYERVPTDEIMAAYEGAHVSLTKLGNYYGKGPDMVQLMDFFAVPEIVLLANLTTFFRDNNITHVPQYLYYDVRNCIEHLHISGILHSTIIDNIDIYLRKHTKIPKLLEHLQEHDKKVFLITNSPFHFVNEGMNYIVGPGWEKLFDVIVMQARKPKFFAGSQRPFREFDPERGGMHWQQVARLAKGKYYIHGNLELFRKLTGWRGTRVLYFGDHVYADLADAAMQHGWRTAAIIPEIDDEVRIGSSPEGVRRVQWLVSLRRLIQWANWGRDDPEVRILLDNWRQEKHEVQLQLKHMYNPYFGSIFRAYENPTYFARRLGRFANLYMSSVVNLLDYPLDYSFYTRRSPLPHEYAPF